MLIHNQVITLPYSKESLCDLVADVEKYPEFLPWCNKCRIIQRKSSNHFFAELEVSYKAFKKSYVSEIVITSNDGKNIIDVNMVKGPFRILKNIWEFADKEDGAEISFFIKLELKSRVLDSLLKSLFENVYKKMLLAFRERAENTL